MGRNVLEFYEKENLKDMKVKLAVKLLNRKKLLKQIQLKWVEKIWKFVWNSHKNMTENMMKAVNHFEAKLIWVWFSEKKILLILKKLKKFKKFWFKSSL